MVYAKNSVPIEAIPNESSDSARQRLYENSPNRTGPLQADLSANNYL